MVLTIKPSAERSGDFQQTTNSSSEKSLRFQSIPGYPGGGIWLDKNNRLVPWQDGSGRSRMLMEEVFKSYLEAYAGLATMFVPFAKAGSLVGKVAVKGWEFAKAAWQGLVSSAASTPQGLEILQRAQDCLASFDPGSTPVPTPGGYGCGAAQKIKEIGEYFTDEK